jgi:hypothetical protein
MRSWALLEDVAAHNHDEAIIKTPFDGRVVVSGARTEVSRCGGGRRLALAENCSAATARLPNGQ